MDNAAALAQITKDLSTLRGRRAFVGHSSMEGKVLTRQIEYLERCRRDLTTQAAAGQK